MKILITEPTDFSEKALEELRSHGEVIFGPLSRGQLIAKIEDTNVLILRLGHVIDAEVLKNAKNLQYILTPTTGLNHIDTAFCKKQHISILSLYREEEFLNSIPSTAEHTWALLMSLIRKIPMAHTSVIDGEWNRDAFKSHNLNALSLGILGFGRVGKQIARIAQAFDMKVFAYDSEKKEIPKNVTLVEDLNELMKVSDILSIHVNLISENRYLINKENLQYAKPGMFLINTSRGELINEEDLVNALSNGSIKGVAVDVLDNELNEAARNQSSLLAYAKKNDNVIITPHIAGATQESMWMTEEFVVQKLLKVLELS